VNNFGKVGVLCVFVCCGGGGGRVGVEKKREIPACKSTTGVCESQSLS